MIKAAIFDLDNTIYDFDSANRHAMEVLAQYAADAFGVEPCQFDEDFRRCQAEQFSAHGTSAGCHSRAIRSQMYLEKNNLPLSHAAGMNELYWNALLEQITPFDGITELLDTLRKRHLKIGICTNMTADWQLKKLEKLGLFSKIDFFVSSEEAESEKPAPGIFQLAAQKAKASPRECVFIGDNPKCDIQGASAIGMHTVWFAGCEKERDRYPDLPCVTSVLEILPAIERLAKELA